MTRSHPTRSALVRHVAIAGFVVPLALSMACVAGPPTSAGNPAPSAATQVSALPAWPRNGIAQRRFDGGVMFVETDHGKLHAWVLSMPLDDKASVEALDFFSGKVMKVKGQWNDEGRQDASFTDPNGKYHFYSADPRFRFSGTDMMRSLPGLNFIGQVIDVDSRISNCSLHLEATTPIKNYLTGQEPAVAWQKFPIYHTSAPPQGCSSGDLTSAIDSALDLGDGTFLAAEGCFVFRLRKSDLSPVGSAPALRVLDESTIKVALAKLHGKTVDDLTGYTIRTLTLPSGPGVSCKED